MRFLLDTQIVIWAMVGSSRLSARAREILENSDNEFCVSAVSVWETAIKHSIKPEAIPVTAEQIVRFCSESGIEELRIGFEHSQCADSLPRHHNDPFDRMLVAQAQVEGLYLLSHDGKLPPYGDFVVHV